MANKRMSYKTPKKEDRIFEIANEVQNPIFITPDQRKNQRVSRYDSDY